MDYYEQNGSAIIQRAKALLAGEEWEGALFELTAIPQECSSYPQAAKLMGTVYTAHINHDAAQTLAEARAVWSADPNPGPSADKAMEILSGINTSASCYPQAKALMEKIEARVKSVTDREYKNEVEMEKARINAESALEKARINACREIAVAYAKRNVTVQHYYRYW